MGNLSPPPDLSPSRVTLVFQIETPMYLAGSDKTQVEMRVSSIKGLLRFWYRAIQPDYTTEEEILFGGMNKGQSPLRLRIAKMDEQKLGYVKKPKPRYLGFSLDDRSFFPPKKTFQLEATMNRNGDNVSLWRAYLSSAWLLTAMGGIGARVRRGFGGCSLQKMSSTADVNIEQIAQSLPKLSKATDLADWEDQFTHGLKQLWQWYPPQQEVTHTVVNQDLRIFVSPTVKSNYKDALTTGAKVLEVFRKEKGKRNNMRQALGHWEEERFPSPVWLRIIHIQEEYYPVFFFISTPLPKLSYTDALDRFANLLLANDFQESRI
ncbi:CRISPR type III-B/RAMP module RAMP protein Cmr1 [Seinonella peptonophila]|uniref:CRISPR type III-B/RAMP module RAMP protein Cmr1 n=1 Tax=Seinonella peptonophila TaxID=112248 RepID=A0A1M5BMJ4_9BACL|nr:type III-B CRISPR module RAMP protein Cmr1 [Seinonella peptonophila]SHF43728.1 CRISPR type III-B/RAMP module RAMP protein Cmr1 [Seinonella peptonophila]